MHTRGNMKNCKESMSSENCLQTTEFNSTFEGRRPCGFGAATLKVRAAGIITSIEVDENRGLLQKLSIRRGVYR